MEAMSQYPGAGDVPGRTPTAPCVDEDGLFHYDGQWVALGPVESRIAALLVRRPGSVVRHAELAAASPGPVGASGRRMVVFRLRRHLAQLGLELRSVRAKGYVLDVPTRTVGELFSPRDHSLGVG